MPQLLGFSYEDLRAGAHAFRAAGFTAAEVSTGLARIPPLDDFEWTVLCLPSVWEEIRRSWWRTLAAWWMATP